VDTATEVKPLVEVVTVNGLSVSVTATLNTHHNPPFIAYVAVCGESAPVKHSTSFHPNPEIVAGHIDAAHPGCSAKGRDRGISA
jgi:hypothetical protein